MILGLLALITPLTPGSWLIFVGAEMLGFELIYWKRIKEWWSRRNKPNAVPENTPSGPTSPQ